MRTLALVMGTVAMTAAVASAEVTSGPQVGEQVGAFTVTKVAGNADDGVADGKTLCYRCRMGQRPVVMVFARSADENLAKFVKELEEEIEEHQDAKLSAFVNMIGTDEEALKKAAADFVAKHGITRVAFVVPTQAKDGPENLKIAPDADLTVVCYKEGTVKANHAFAAGGLSEEQIDAIVHASCEMAE
jgi:hypothetical protein